MRSGSEESPPEIDHSSIRPGDQILVRLESSPGDMTKEAWFYVVGKKPKNGFIQAVMDELLLVNKTTQFRQDEVVQVKKEDVLAVIDGHAVSNCPVIRIMIQDGQIIGVRRVDGKTSPVILVLDEDDSEMVYEVTHLGSKKTVFD